MAGMLPGTERANRIFAQQALPGDPCLGGHLFVDWHTNLRFVPPCKTSGSLVQKEWSRVHIFLAKPDSGDIMTMNDVVFQ